MPMKDDAGEWNCELFFYFCASLRQPGRFNERRTVIGKMAAPKYTEN
jgi:hypothetical protein